MKYMYDNHTDAAVFDYVVSELHFIPRYILLRCLNKIDRK